MKTKGWQNHYIPLCESKPEYIIAADNSGFREGQKEKLLKRIGDYKKVYLEIGSGSGAHLIDRAALDPNSLYIGIELRFKRTFRTAEKAEVRGIKNLLIIRSDARTVFEALETNSLDGVYVNFPDPWADRKKWKKHRILSDTTVTKLEQILSPSGFISYKTDHQEYFETTHQLFNNSEFYKVVKFTKNLHLSSYAAESIDTEFELLFKSKGLPIFFLEAAVVGNSSEVEV